MSSLRGREKETETEIVKCVLTFANFCQWLHSPSSLAKFLESQHALTISVSDADFREIYQLQPAVMH